MFYYILSHIVVVLSYFFGCSVTYTYQNRALREKSQPWFTSRFLYGLIAMNWLFLVFSFWQGILAIKIEMEVIFETDLLYFYSSDVEQLSDRRWVWYLHAKSGYSNWPTIFYRKYLNISKLSRCSRERGTKFIIMFFLCMVFDFSYANSLIINCMY